MTVEHIEDIKVFDYEICIYRVLETQEFEVCVRHYCPTVEDKNADMSQCNIHDGDCYAFLWKGLAKTKSDAQRKALIKIYQLEKPERPNFTNEQIDFICYQIGEWYVQWKNNFINYDERTHRLGYAKEKLKVMICGEYRDQI